MSDTNIPVWDGNRKNMPQIARPFMFANKEYLWFMVNDQALVVDTKEGEPNLPMSIRLFPGKTGCATVDVIFKVGVASAEQIATAFETGDKIVFKWLDQATEEALNARDPKKWLKEKNITLDELMEIRQATAMAMLTMELTDLLG